MPHPVPEGRHALTPHLIVKGASEAIEFYKRALGAEEISRFEMPGNDGRLLIGHADLQVNDSHLFLSDEFPEQGGVGPGSSSPVTIHLYVTDADAAFNRAVAAGAKVVMPLDNMFWGDRYGKLVDPFGHHWSIAEHLEDLSPQQMRERMAAMFTRPGCE